MPSEVSYDEYKRLWDLGIIQSIQRRGYSGVVSQTIPYGLFKILSNRKEGVVGSMLAMPECCLLPEGEL